MLIRRRVQIFHLWRQYSTVKPSYLHHVGEEPLRHITVGQLLEETAQKFGDRNAIISRHQKRSITFWEVLQEADKLAAGLQALGLERNDRVGLWSPNLIEWYVMKMACARAGLITVALNPAYQPPEMEYCINKVNMKAILCGDQFKQQDYYQHMVAIAPELPNSDPGKLESTRVPSLKTVISISDNQKKGAIAYNELLALATNEQIEEVRKYQNRIVPDSPLNIQFTSGTTGKPKAALNSHFNLVNNGFYIGKRTELSIKHHKICLQVPFFHAFGISISISAALNHGATLVLPTDGYNPDKSLDAIKEEKCTMLHGTPTMYVDLIHRQEERKEYINPEIAVCGGALCAPHLFKQMLEVLKVKKVRSVYGLTETTAVIFHSMISDEESLSTTTVGHLGEHLEAKVIDGDGLLVPFGMPGELCIRGYCNILEYWDDEKKTKELRGVDGWLKTGDQFILEANGYGKIVGRLKEMIIRGGENIYPKEIEDYLNTHPDILEAQVIGVPHERLGEEVYACLRLKPEKTITLEEVKQFCKGQIAHFKIPSNIEVMSVFPKTTSGKIQKFQLLEYVRNKKQ